MIYKQTLHPKVKVGQLWHCTAGNILIVAVDSCLDGFVINVLLDTNGVKRVLAPIRWQELEPHLGEVIDDNIDISEHLDSYCEWKELAQEGKAGFWTCTLTKILAIIRKNIDERGNDISNSEDLS